MRKQLTQSLQVWMLGVTGLVFYFFGLGFRVKGLVSPLLPMEAL